MTAQDRPLPIKICVDSIVATYAPERPGEGRSYGAQQSAARPPVVKMDPRLVGKGLATRLRLMFDYNDYRLIKSQREVSSLGGAVAFNLPGGHILQVAPLGLLGEDAVAMELALFEGARLIMHLPFRVTSGGALMLVDQHYPNRFYITAISLDNAGLRGERHGSGATPQNAPAPVPPMPAWIPSE